MQKITIVGVGNRLVEQDRIGPKVVEDLRNLLSGDFELVELSGGGLGLLDIARKQDLLVVVDACALGGEPGWVEVFEFDGLPVDSVSVGGVTMHQIGPYEALKVVEALYPERMPRRVCFVLIETSGMEEDLPSSSRARATEIILDLIQETGLGSSGVWMSGDHGKMMEKNR